MEDLSSTNLWNLANSNQNLKFPFQIVQEMIRFNEYYHKEMMSYGSNYGGSCRKKREG